jgi:hypothetical protein
MLFLKGSCAPPHVSDRTLQDGSVTLSQALRARLRSHRCSGTRLHTFHSIQQEPKGPAVLHVRPHDSPPHHGAGEAAGVAEPVGVESGMGGTNAVSMILEYSIETLPARSILVALPGSAYVYTASLESLSHDTRMAISVS